MSCSSAAPCHGRPDAILPQCPRLRVLDYETSWHALPGAPLFLICARCFADSIQSTLFAPLFIRVKTPLGRCHFHVPRVVALWSMARQTQNISPLVKYASMRSTVPDCLGPSGAMDGVVEWYYAPSANLPGFVVCEACYEDYVAESAFALRFARCETQESTEVWSCDFSVPAIRAAFDHYSGETPGEWDAFAEVMRRRMSLWCGPGAQLRRIQINKTGLDITICRACYEDNISPRPVEEQFQIPGDSKQEQEERTCSFATPSLAFAYDIAIERGDFSIFERAADVVMSGPSCGFSGETRGALRYGMVGDDILDTCPACYAGVIAALRLSSLFEAKHVEGKPCALRVGYVSFEACVRRLREAADKGSLFTLLSWAREVAGTPSCPGSVLTPGLKWYGWKECTICLGCHHSAAYGTWLTPTFTLRETTIGEPTMCCLYSDHMR